MSQVLDQSDRSFLDSQNRFRGLISQLRSRRFIEDPKIRPTHRFRIGLAEWLLDARARVEPRRYREILEWQAVMSAAQLLELQHSPVGYEELGGIYVRADTVSLENELRWIAERIRIERKRIDAFLEARQEIERSVLGGRVEEAIKAIELVQTALGASIWSVQLRIALEHLAGGLERQKQYTAEVRAVYRHGLLGFTAYHTSVRNEGRTTLAKFLEDIEQRIDRHSKYDDAVKNYLRYRLKSEFAQGDVGLAEVLRVEQSHGIVDTYETFVAVLQEIARRQPGPIHGNAVVEAIRAIGNDDFRLAKILHLLEPATIPALPTRDPRLSDALFSGRLVSAARIVRNERGTVSADPWRYIYSAFSLAPPRPSDDAFDVTPQNFVELIARVQSRCDGSDGAWDQATKLSLNVLGLPLAAGLWEFLHQLRRSTPDKPWRPWFIGLHSHLRGPEDRAWTLGCDVEASPQGITEQVWYEASCPGTVSGTPFRLARAAGLLEAREFSSAIDALGPFGEPWPAPLRNLRALLLLHAHFAHGDRAKVIALIADEGSRSQSHARFLPVAAALGNYHWSDFKGASGALDAAIALHLLWTVHESSVVASRMRFATGAALRALGVQRPSDLVAMELDVPRHQLIYFLKNLCVPDILDVTRLFSGTRAILEERQVICAQLIRMDPTRRDDYETEITLTANRLSMDEGHWIVDSTRIHVDSDALIRWAFKTLEEDYSRYRDLERLTIVGPQAFDDVLRELESLPSQRTSFIPETEADAVLVSLLRRIGEEFLTNAVFGLDFYLSKRVRHQSFIGLIRGPLEFAKLITTRESEATDYHRNEAWLERFTQLDHVALDNIDIALRRFASRFDETLAEAKDAFFHLRNAEKPDGMIVLSLGDREIRLARGLIQLDLSFQDFLQLAITIMWASVEPSLEAIRRYIDDNLKAQLINEFDLVRATVRALAEQDPAFLEFDAAMGRGSAEVQVKLDEAAQWFVHADTLSNRRFFSLKQMLEIAVENVLKTQRGYNPDIRQEASGDLQLQAPNLVFIHDVVFTGVGNAQKHSGLKAPKIDVAVRWNQKASTLTVEVISDCKASLRADKEKRSDVIRSAIDSGMHPLRTRTEEGSGFAKIAAVVSQSERGRLHFGFTEEGRFKLEVTFAVLNQVVEANAA
jgi:hypothetical protein